MAKERSETQMHGQTGKITIRIDKRNGDVQVAADNEEEIFISVATYGHMESINAIRQDFVEMGLSVQDADKWAQLTAEDIRRRAIIETLLS